MTQQRLTPWSYGPFTKGVVQSANRQMDLTQALRFARNARFSGIGRLKTRGGDQVALTLFDDAGTPAEITNVIAVSPFGDGAIAIGYSSGTGKVYLYHLSADMNDWYDVAGAAQGSTNAEPVGVLWDTVTDVPVVTIAEGLGVAYIAHNAALDATAISFPTKTFSAPGTIATLTGDLDEDTTAEDIAFLGVASFNQHLIGFGFDQSSTAATAYRPELIRHSAPNFGPLADRPAGSGSFTIGHAVRSARERVTGIFVAGEVCYFGLNFGLWGMVGEGRESFQKKSLSSTKGIAGVMAACEGPDGWLYGYAHTGPFRVQGLSAPEELQDSIIDTVQAIPNPNRVIVAYDDERDQVCFFYDSNGVRNKFASFDHTRNLWLGPDSALGVGISCAARISPVFGAAVAANGPDGPPVSGVTSDVGTSNATASWTPGDTAPETSTIVEVRRQGATAWTPVTTVGSGVTSATITGLTNSVDYEWRAAHLRNGQLSSYLGPDVDTQFTTGVSSGGGGGGGGGSDTMTPPSNLALQDMSFIDGDGVIQATWTNSGESGAYTEVWSAGPSASAPAAGAYVLQFACYPGVAALEYVSGGVAGKYWGKIRHVRGADSSPYTAAVSVDVSTDSP